MTNILQLLGRRLANEDGFVIGRVALVVLILAIVIVAALVAFVVPN
jgi:ABC-type Fe3+-siderophore transport system permease subunit